MGHRQRGRKIGPCELCGRDCSLTFHHLIPRKVHGNKWFRKRFDLQQMRETGLDLCRLCHQGIHTLIPCEKELARNYQTRAALLEHPGIAKHVDWVRKQKP